MSSPSGLRKYLEALGLAFTLPDLVSTTSEPAFDPLDEEEEEEVLAEEGADALVVDWMDRLPVTKKEGERQN